MEEKGRCVSKFFPTEQNVLWSLCHLLILVILLLQVPSAELEPGFFALANSTATTTFPENTNYNPLVKIRAMLICPLKISSFMQTETRRFESSANAS